MKKILICPAIDLKVELSFAIGSAVTIQDVVKMIESDEFTAIAFSDMRVLECFCQYADLFGVEPVTLIGVPTADYTPAFEQITWSNDKLSYDTLVVEAQTVKRMDFLKNQEKPRKQGERELPSEEDVRKAKAPNAINWVKDPRSGGESEQEE